MQKPNKDTWPWGQLWSQNKDVAARSHGQIDDRAENKGEASTETMKVPKNMFGLPSTAMSVRCLVWGRVLYQRTLATLPTQTIIKNQDRTPEVTQVQSTEARVRKAEAQRHTHTRGLGLGFSFVFLIPEWLLLAISFSTFYGNIKQPQG